MTGDLFASESDVFVNATNASGRMGAGIAGVFARRYPEYLAHYQREYSAGNLSMGEVHSFHTAYSRPRAIVSLHTMERPGSAADVGGIAAGLDSLVSFMLMGGYKSVSIPALGCGIGGLSFAVLEPMVREAFILTPGIDVQLFKPHD